VPSIGAEEAE